MHLFLLLQHIVEPGKAAVAIADSGSTNQLVQTLIVAAATGIMGYLIKSLITRPAEKAELYEQAKIQAISDSLKEHKDYYQRASIEWHSWRDLLSNRVTTVELQQKAMSEQLTEKIKDLTDDVSETKGITQDIRESLAGLKVQMEQTIGKWTK